MPAEWKLLEIEYGRRMRAASREERKKLYAEATAAVAALRMANLPNTPQAQTAGTSDALIRFLIRQCGPTDTVLEVGCGAGYTCWKLAPHVKRIIGVDVSEPRLKEAKSLLERSNVANAEVRAVSGDELASTFGPESFDKVVSVDVYEHLHPDEGAEHLREVFKVLRPGGEYIVIAANRLGGPTDVTCEIYPESPVPMGFHFNETTHEDLARELRATGFGSIRCAWRAPKFLPVAFHLPVPLKGMIAFEHAFARLRRKSILWQTLRSILTINIIARKD